jgi:hypothetical protein
MKFSPPFPSQRAVPVRYAHLHGALGWERKTKTTPTNNHPKSTKFISGLDRHVLK